MFILFSEKVVERLLLGAVRYSGIHDLQRISTWGQRCGLLLCVAKFY